MVEGPKTGMWVGIRGITIYVTLKLNLIGERKPGVNFCSEYPNPRMRITPSEV